MLINRILASLAVALTIFAIGIAFMNRVTPIYEAIGQVEVIELNKLNRESTETIEDYLQVFHQPKIRERLHSTLSDDPQALLFEPHPERDRSLAAIWKQSASFHQIRDSNIIACRFRHSNPKVALFMCDLIMDEYINYWLVMDIDNDLGKVEKLRIEADQTKDEIQKLQAEIDALLEKQQILPTDEAESLEPEIYLLKEKIKSSKDSLEKLMKKMQLERAIVSLATPRVRILEKATISDSPAYPNTSVFILSSAMIGCLSAVIFFLSSKRLFQSNAS
jgi:Protein involved in chromosome segregation, interacts with SMC proteins